MGRKKTRKGQEKKPRLAEIQVTFDSAGQGTVNIFADGSMAIVGTDGRPVLPSRVEVASVYNRSNGKPDKVLTRTTGIPSAIHLDPNKALEHFGSVFAVDTNTTEIRGVQISVCVSLMITDITVTPDKWQARPSMVNILEFQDSRQSPERVGWNFAVRTIEPLIVPQPVALVVDSDLAAHPAINRREQPYFESQLLPPAFTLAYASSDAGTTEFIANKAIATCDTFATQILQRISADIDINPQYQTDPTLPVARFRSWKIAATR